MEEGMYSVHKSLSLAELALTTDKILAGMGYANFLPDKKLVEKTSYLLEQSGHYSNPSFSYTIYESSIEKTFLSIENIHLHPGKIIIHSLKGATQLAVFTATAGALYQKWSKNWEGTDDTVGYYIADCIGTEIVEATADYMQKHLATYSEKGNYKITNRYSPGYCGWNIREQHSLFSLLDEVGSCGIRLLDSGLMYPIKSVSGIIGIGKNVKQKEYGCSQCNFPHCFKRK